MYIRATYWALVLLVALALSACRSSVSQADAEAFGRRVAELMEHCDPVELAPLWESNAFIARAVAHLKLPGARRSAELSLRRDYTALVHWSRRCAHLFAAGPLRTRFLKVREEAGTWRPIVRLLTPSGVNYIEFELGRFSGETRAVDETDFRSGRPRSEDIGRLMAATEFAKDVRSAETAKQLALLDAFELAGDTEAALAVIIRLPIELQRDRVFMLRRISLEDDEARYLAAVEDFEKTFPNDPALALLSLDVHLLRNDFVRFHAALDPLEQRVSDPYLAVMRGDAYVAAELLDEALKHFDVAIEREPDLQDAWEGKATTCVIKKDFVCAVNAFKVLVDRFVVTIDESTVLELDHGAELVASKPWKAWRKSLVAP